MCQQLNPKGPWWKRHNWKFAKAIDVVNGVLTCRRCGKKKELAA